MNFHATYREAIERSRHTLGARIANNTRIRREGADLRVRLHNTDIVDVKPDNSLVLNMDGWNTITTRERINRFTMRHGVRLYSEKGIPYLAPMGNWEARVPYKDGARIYPGGRITKAGTFTAAMKRDKQRTQVRKFAKDYMKALVAGKVPAPGHGDCLFCQLRNAEDGRPMKRADHILSHMRERYFVPSMIWNANDRTAFPNANVSQAMVWALQSFWIQDDAEREKAASWRQGFVLKGIEKNLVKWIEFNLGGYAT